MKVRIGVGYSGAAAPAPVEPVDFAALVDGLEGHGFDSLWLTERINSNALDPVVGLTYAAARTTKLKLGTAVMVLPGRNPVVLAKELATLDHLSGGRLLPGFGLGAVHPAEQSAFGVAREERSSWFDEALPLLQRLWTEDDVHHTGPRFSLHGVSVRPRPPQTPLEPWLGGLAPGELRRVGRLSDGWLPSFMTPEEVLAGKEIVDAAAAEAGRTIDPEHFGALVTYTRSPLPDHVRARFDARRSRLGPVAPEDVVPVGFEALRALLERFVDVGFSKFVVLPVHEPERWDHELAELADAVLDLQGASRQLAV